MQYISIKKRIYQVVKRVSVCLDGVSGHLSGFNVPCPVKPFDVYNLIQIPDTYRGRIRYVYPVVTPHTCMVLVSVMQGKVQTHGTM